MQWFSCFFLLPVQEVMFTCEYVGSFVCDMALVSFSICDVRIVLFHFESNRIVEILFEISNRIE